jgi:hypothetical protein
LIVRTKFSNTERMMSDPYEPSYTVDEFCVAERISRVMLYEDWKHGNGPRFYYNGRRRIIPHSARLEYQQRKMDEAEAKGGAHVAS